MARGTPSCHSFAQSQYLLKNLFSIDLIRVDQYGIMRRLEWSHIASGINPITLEDHCQDIVVIGLPATRNDLIITTLRALLRRGIQIDLQIGFGQYHRPDIAPNHDDLSALTDAPLLLAQRLTYATIGRDDGYICIHFRQPRFPGNIFSCDQDVADASILL